MTYQNQIDTYGKMPARPASGDDDQGMSMRAHFASIALAPVLQRFFQGMQERFPESEDEESPKFHLFEDSIEYVDVATAAWAIAEAMMDCAPESELAR